MRGEESAAAGRSLQDEPAPAEERSPPRGRDAVRAALIEAAARCFAERGINATPIRDIASRAKVNHGLIHRHFGGKDGLLRALLAQLSEEVNRTLDERFADGLPPPRELIPLIFGGTERVGLHWRVVERALLEGLSPEALQSDFPVFRRLVTSYEGLGYSATAALAEASLTFATGLGFLSFQGYLEAAVDARGGDWGEVRRELMGRFLARVER